MAGSADPAALRDAVIARARELELSGWARAGDDGAVRVHAEGEAGALAELTAFLGAAEGPEAVSLGTAKREGHEQFAPRGVPAGVFVVQEHRATAHHWDFRLEVDGVMRSWAVPKGPSLDPGVKRLAVQVEDHGMAHNDYEGDNVIIWDRGLYEQGGRVPWPRAVDERGHAVFVLHGEKLSGGFALQRTGGRGGAATKKPQWLLIKRKDDAARPGSDVVAERPESVVTGKPLPVTPGSS
ncbi:DNA polymerase ligase N-terminal domain-containing protein [Baekduia sp. Peel2402]|uniref:DNA polymerase ligase N-terminal domain-containing protein n=1 Tax=Baekduia sp. Peel2402 TaxID=3458296 RepID=UPI00403E8695